MKRDVIVVDIDGTILDSTAAIEYLDGTKDTLNYEVYFRLLDKVKPIGETIKLVWKYINLDCDVIFLTARNCEKHSAYYTMASLEELFGLELPYDKQTYNVMFRALGDKRPSAEMKKEKIQQIAEYNNIIATFDDEPGILKEYAKLPCLENATKYLITYFNWDFSGISYADHEDSKYIKVLCS